MFDRNVLNIDLEREADEICAALRETVSKRLMRRGVVVAISGGIDSSCTAGLAVRAFGPKKVFGLLLPERDSSGASVKLGTQLAKHLGIEYAVEDIQPHPGGHRLLPTVRRGHPDVSFPSLARAGKARSCCPATCWTATA